MKEKVKKKDQIFEMEHPILNNFSSIVSTLLAGAALWVAISTMNKATKQFNENAIQSDSLFNVQLKQNGSLFNEQIARNDSLIKQISKLQNITDKQLRVLNTTLEENKLAGRPIFYIGETKIKKIDNSNSEIFTPEIQTPFTNIGHRFALKVRLRCFVIVNDFKEVHYEFDSLRYTIAPQTVSAHLAHPKIPIEFKDNFYYCFEITYYDEKQNKHYRQIEYMHYYKVQDFQFFYADNEENKFRTAINASLKTLNIPLVEQSF